MPAFHTQASSTTSTALHRPPSPPPSTALHQAIGDTPRQRDHDTNSDGIFDHLRDEEADIVLYGAELAADELPGIRHVVEPRLLHS